MKRHFMSIVVLITILVLLAGAWFYRHIHDRIPDTPVVTASNPETPPDSAPETEAAAPSEESTISKGFPMTIRDMMNNTVTLKQKPEKIAVISGPLLEMFYGLGGQSICTVNPEELKAPLADAGQLPSIGKAANPDIIAILELEPDLVIAEAGVQNEIVTTLQKSKLQVVALKSKGDANREKSLNLMKAIAGLE